MPFSNPKRLLPAFLACALVIALGAIEDWLGRFDYAGDAIAYLDVSKAIHDGDWALAFNPYWSIGYPAILTATRWLFPTGPQGEWTAVHVVNLSLFLGTYLSFLYLLRMAQVYTARANGMEEPGSGSGFIYAIGTALFLLLQLMIGNVSRVSPDLSVSGVFFLATAVSLQFSLRPRITTAVALGLLMGVGYILKAVFLPLDAMLFLVLLLRTLLLPRSELPTVLSKLAWALPAAAVLAVPYIAANSNAAGFFTLGETGGLNYAWNVNHLPAFTHWQGGPGPVGTPEHPTHLVLESPHVFAFQEPFHVTYPPWFNPFYWYEGYRHFFQMGNQLGAFHVTIRFLRHFFLGGPVSLAVIALLGVGLFFFRDRAHWWRRVLGLWPVYLPSLLSASVYFVVVMEARYLVGFMLIALMTPVLALFAPTPLVSRKTGFVITALLVFGCAGLLAVNQKETVRRLVHGESYTTDPQWKTGLFLAQSGIKPGDKGASVAEGGGMHCTWAKVSGVHIVAEIGENSVAPADEGKDFHLFLQDAAVQENVFTLFRQAGATFVVAINVNGPIVGQGWQLIPGTNYWVHRL